MGAGRAQARPAGAPGGRERLDGFLDRMGGVCRALAQLFLWSGAAALLIMTAVVGWQVWGRYVLNETPIAAEAVSLLLMLYLSLLGAAVGVRDRFHLGVVFVRDGVPLPWRNWLDIVNHLLVGAFAAGMVWYGWLLAASTWDHTMPTTGISQGINYLPIPLSGAATLLFVVEHILAILAGRAREPEPYGGGVE